VLNRRDTNLVRAPRSGRGGWLVLLLCLGFSLQARAASASPGKLDIDSFERLKSTLTLSDGETLAYISRGDEHGPPVVLIHGYTDSALDWLPMVPELSPRLHLILVDIRGHGRSSAPECCYTRLDFAYDIKLLLDALHIARADVVGHSLGSIIAQTFAEYWPEHTRRLILISSTGRSWYEQGRPPEWVSRIRALKEPIDPDSEFMLWWWSSPRAVDPDFLRHERRAAAAIPLYVWHAVLDQALADTGLQRTLPLIRAPTLLIWGAHDPLIPPAARRALRASLPHAVVKIFPAYGHNPLWEDPRACAEVINSFLTAAPPGAAAM
jgi:pimeloyl-ACP methyl ester carboxylesterase